MSAKSSINIREFDRTTFVNRVITNNNRVLFIVNNSTAEGKLIEFNSMNDFESYATRTGIWISTEYELQEYIWNLLRLGLPVSLFAGTINATNLEILLDKIKYKFFAIVPWDCDVSIVQNAISPLVDDSGESKGRGDCIIVLDESYLQSNGSAPLSNSYIKYIVPNVKFVPNYVTGGTTAGKITLPGSYAFFTCIAKGLNEGLPIYSIWAGPKRAVVDQGLELTRSYTINDANNNELLGIDTIIDMSQYGNVIVGNTTSLYPGSVTSTPTAVSDLNFYCTSNTAVINSDTGEASLTMNEGVGSGKSTETSVSYSNDNVGTSFKLAYKRGDIQYTKSYSILPYSSTSTSELKFDENGQCVITEDNTTIVTINIIGETSENRLRLGFTPNTGVTLNSITESTIYVLNYSYTYNKIEVTPNPTTSALQECHVRMTANEIKKYIYDICLGLIFDTNDYILWTEFDTKLRVKLDAMKSNRAISDYIILMADIVDTDDINSNRIPGIVRVSIARSAKSFDINFELTPVGANINE